MTHTELRVVNQLALKPQTRRELSESCFTSLANIHKIIQRLLSTGTATVVGKSTFHGYRNGKLSVDVYGISKKH